MPFAIFCRASNFLGGRTFVGNESGTFVTVWRRQEYGVYQSGPPLPLEYFRRGGPAQEPWTAIKVDVPAILGKPKALFLMRGEQRLSRGLGPWQAGLVRFLNKGTDPGLARVTFASTVDSPFGKRSLLPAQVAVTTGPGPSPPGPRRTILLCRARRDMLVKHASIPVFWSTSPMRERPLRYHERY